MNEKRNISITGCIGAGKSRICEEIEKKGYHTVTAGSVFRMYAKEHGISIGSAIKGHEDIDEKIDLEIARIGKEKRGIIFDSRLAWHFVPDSFKVFVYADTEIAAERVFRAGRETEKFENVQECRQEIILRQKEERQNYMNLYDIDYMDSKNYDLFIDASYATAEEVADKILECMENRQEKFQMNPRSLYPTQCVRDLSEEALNQYLSGLIPVGGICIANFNGYFVIIDGHHRFLAAAIHQKPFLGAFYDSEPEMSSIVSKKEIYNYEDIAGFFYERYPEESSKENLINFQNEIVRMNLD